MFLQCNKAGHSKTNTRLMIYAASLFVSGQGPPVVFPASNSWHLSPGCFTLATGLSVKAVGCNCGTHLEHTDLVGIILPDSLVGSSSGAPSGTCLSDAASKPCGKHIVFSFLFLIFKWQMVRNECLQCYNYSPQFLSMKQQLLPCILFLSSYFLAAEEINHRESIPLDTSRSLSAWHLQWTQFVPQ